MKILTFTALLLSCLFAFLFLSCSRKPETPDVIVLQTGRLRGNVYPDNLKGIAPLQYYPYIAGYVEKVRAQAARDGSQVVLIDLGDSLTGSFASLITHGRNVAHFFNELRYDAIMLGNLDGDVSPEVIRQLRMPVLCPFQTKDGEPAMPGSRSVLELKKGAFQLQLLPNFYGDVSPESFPTRFPVSFGGNAPVQPIRDYRAMAGSLAPKSPNALRMLGWLKFEQSEKPPAEFIQLLQTYGFDLIAAHRVYGSSKKDIWSEDSLIDWAVPVSQNILRDNRGFTLARVDLKKTASGWKILRHALEPMTANTAPADPQVEKSQEQFGDLIREADEELVDLKQDVTAGEIEKMFLAALATVPGVQAALYSPASIRADWSKGKLRASRVYESLPWSNQLVRVQLTADQWKSLRAARKYSLLIKPGAEAASSMELATSHFFGRILAERFSIPESAVQPVSDEWEFQLLNRKLKENGSILLPPDGWSYETAEAN